MRPVLLGARHTPEAGADGCQREDDVAVGVPLHPPRAGDAGLARGAVDVGRDALDGDAARGGLEAERVGGPARLHACAPQDEQLVDALLGLRLGAPAAGIDDVLRLGAAVGKKDLAHALAGDAEAQRDLVQAAALLAQRLHLAHALQRSRHEGALVAGRRIQRRRQRRSARRARRVLQHEQ